jgi:hypothetical protein
VVLMGKEKVFNEYGMEVIEIIQQDNFIIEIVKQEYKEEKLDSLYELIAKLLYKRAGI